MSWVTRLLRPVLYPDKPDRVVFRLSHALSERGTYSTDLSGYEPLVLPGDPALPPRIMNKRTAARTAQAFLDALPERSAYMRAFVEARRALDPKVPLSEPDGWHGIDALVIDAFELAAPQDMQGQPDYWRYRPKFHALLYDLSLLFASEAAARLANAQLVFEGDTTEDVGAFESFPVLARGNKFLASTSPEHLVLADAMKGEGPFFLRFTHLLERFGAGGT